MQIKLLTLVGILILATCNLPIASANEKPKIESFNFSPIEIDLQSGTNKVDFELVVSHPFGIENITTFVTLTGSQNNKLGTILSRTNSEAAAQNVKFIGSIVLAQNLLSDVYKIKVDPVKNNTSAGYQYFSDSIESVKIRNLVGGESGLIVRSGGELNLNYPTIVGPSYDTSAIKSFIDPAKFSVSQQPIWKVGEVFNPNTYFEVQVPSLKLEINSFTPNICIETRNELKLLNEGLCNFKVFTSKTNDYLPTSIQQSVNITSARVKPQLQVSTIPPMDSKILPLNISIPPVYSLVDGYIQPINSTPSVCIASTFFVRVLSGGKCEFSYQSTANSMYLASDEYKVSFEITRDRQTISFTPPATANLSAKTLALSATASSGGVITYQTTSAGICSITGSTLNLLKGGNCSITATQAGSATLAPISAIATVMITGSVAPTKKTITCVKGNKTKKVSGTNPKCPKGYKVKR